MKLMILVCILGLAVGRPRFDDDDDFIEAAIKHEFAKLIRDDRQPFQDGKYFFDFESDDGISRSETGVVNPQTGILTQTGGYSFNFPTGERFTMKFVADENGFHPESPWLPVAPAFPHPIPQFVLDQIEKARLEDLDRDDDDHNNSSGRGRFTSREDDD